jgi:hypothetical protein
MARGSPEAASALDAEAGAALGAAASQNLAAIGSFHAGTETVIAFAFEIAGLVRAFGGHNGTSFKKGCSELEIITASRACRQVTERLAEPEATG